jgi:acetyl-CoA acetyltransferase
MIEAFICDAIRTPFGRYGGALSTVRPDDLGAIPMRALMARNPGVDWAASTTSSTAAPTRPARTTATSRACRSCLPACRRTSRRHRQPPVRLEPRRHRHRASRDQER